LPAPDLIQLLPLSPLKLRVPRKPLRSKRSKLVRLVPVMSIWLLLSLASIPRESLVVPPVRMRVSVPPRALMLSFCCRLARVLVRLSSPVPSANRSWLGVVTRFSGLTSVTVICTAWEVLREASLAVTVMS